MAKSYAEIQKDLNEFLLHFRDPTRAGGEQYKYTRALQAIHSRQGRALVIELDDLVAYFKGPVATAFVHCCIVAFAKSTT